MMAITQVTPSWQPTTAHTEEELVHRDPALRYNEQARTIFRALEQNLDPRPFLPQAEEGFWGRSDVIPHEVEQAILKMNSETLTGAEALNQLSTFFGPSELSTAPEGAGWLERQATRVLGRTSAWGDSDETEALRLIISEKRRREGSPEKATRTMQEVVRGYTPSREEVAGAAPTWMKDMFTKWPYMRNLWYDEVDGDIEGTPYVPAAAITEGQVLERDYGIVPVHNTTDSSKKNYVDPAALKQVRNVIDWLPYVERLDPGATEKIIAPMLAANWNKNYGTEYKPEKFEVQVMESLRGESKNRIMFKHPVTEKFTPIDPFTLEWSDVMGLLPEAMVIGADIAGSVVGAAGGALTTLPTAGALNPVTGASILGMVSTGTASWQRNLQALKKSNYTRNSEGDWVSPSGESTVEGGWPLVLDSFTIPEVYLSGGGNLVAPFIWRAIKSVVHKGPGISKEISDLVDPEQFITAWNHWKSQVAKDPESLAALTTKDLKQEPTASMVTDNWGKYIQQTADDSIDAVERRELEALAIKVRKDAEKLRGLEKGFDIDEAVVREEVGAEAIGAVLRQTEGAGGAPPVIPGKVAPEITPGAVKRADVRGLGETVRGQVEKQFTQESENIDRIIAQNKATMAEIENAIGSPGAPETLGVQLQETAAQIIKDASSIYDDVGKLIGARGFIVPKGIRLDEVAHTYVNVPRSRGGRAAFPDGFIDKWNAQLPDSLRPTRLPKEKGGGVVSPPREVADIPQNRISYENWVATRDLINETLSKTSNTTQRQNLEALRKAWFDDVLLPAINKPKLKAQLIETNAGYERMMQIWGNWTERKIGEGQFTQVANNLFKNNESSHVQAFMNDVWPNLNRENQDLVRTAFKNRLSETYTGPRATAKEVGLDQPASERMGVRTRLTPEGDTVLVHPASAAKLDKFNRDHKNWIEALFPEQDGVSTWSNVVRPLESVGAQKASVRKIESVINDLEQLPWFKQGNLERQGDHLVMHEPGKIIDDVFNSQQPKKALDQLLHIINQLPTRPRGGSNSGILSERDEALHALRAGTFRRIFNPGQAAATTSDVAPSGINLINNLGVNATAELNANRAFYDRLYGPQHVGNMKKFFKIFDEAVGAPPGGRAQNEITTKELRNVAGDVGLAGMKVYVGVLNRKARALTLSKRLLDKYFGTQFGGILKDPETLALWLRFGRRSTLDRATPGALMTALGISQVDADTSEQVYAEFNSELRALVRAREGLAPQEDTGAVPPVQLQQSGIREMSNGGLNMTPNPFPNEVPMPPEQRKRDLHFKALEGGGLTKAEEIEKLELDKNNIVQSIQAEIENIRNRMAEGIGYGRVGKGIGELMGIEAQAPSNWRTDPEVQALMDKMQETRAVFDARIDEVAAAP
jgi:hypothetical protein